MTDHLYPLKFTPIYKEKVWGGRTMEKLGRKLPGDAGVGIGESWELVDLASTSASGGGGGAERSVIANGPLAGKTLHEAIERFGARLMGRLRTDGEGAEGNGGFPLLVKYLDAKENLSVQVHPSEAYAREHPGAYLKSEAWYIVAAEPGAVIYKGIREGVTAAEYRAAIEADSVPGGKGGRVESLMIKVPVKAGDCHYLPSGTCHALGAGVLVAEVQTPSDTTFRVYDWGRTDRQLHIEEAMACIHFGPAETGQYERRTHIAGVFTMVTRLVMCEHFRIEKVRMSQGYEQEIPYDQPAVWMVLEGGGVILPESGSKADKGFEAVRFERGETMLMPAGMESAKVSLEKDTIWLEVTFPQALAEQIA